MEFKVDKVEDWASVAEEILPLLHNNILLLKGNLGAGKTTFTQFLLKAMGSDDKVLSPTYSIVNEYDADGRKIFHFDLYRLKNVREVYEIGIEDYLENARLCIIEWPEIFESELQDLPYRELHITTEGEGRKVNFF